MGDKFIVLFMKPVIEIDSRECHLRTSKCFAALRGLTESDYPRNNSSVNPLPKNCQSGAIESVARMKRRPLG